jgi:bifunctional non-homologous end joining protein LigD
VPSQSSTRLVKLDSGRAIICLSSRSSRLFRRPVSGRSLRSTILDGEIVALDESGIPRFQLLQQWQKRPTAPVVYFLFDLLWFDGRDITGKTVLQRRERLREIVPAVPGIQVGGYVENRGKDLFQLAKENELEGIIAKRKYSIYRPGKRSPDWLKIKSRPQQEFVVCGFTEGKGSRSRHFGAVLLAAYGDGRLRYFGHSGSGFSEKGLQETIARLKPLFIDKPPVENPPKIPERIQWVEPKLVCEVAFAEWTEDGELRQTTFLGWRDDKDPKDIALELQE